MKVKISPPELIKQLQQLQDNENKFRQCFSSHPILEVVYENIVMESESQMKKIEQFLGVTDFQMSSRLLKLGHKSLADSIINFQEIEQALQGTRWERYLYDESQV